MSEWKPKVFWTSVEVTPAEGGHAVTLDGRPVRTPAKTAFVLPARALAEAAAEEWRAQAEHVDPGTMPVTRTANSALDKVAPQKAEVADMLAAYGETDLLCYRAEAPGALVARQGAQWDPLLDWAAEALGARLVPVEGVMPVDQDRAALAALSARVHAMEPFALAAFHDLVALSGSLILAFAVTEGRLPPEEAWTISRLDEDWQSEQWGEDEEAAEQAALKRAAFLHAALFFELSVKKDPALK